MAKPHTDHSALLCHNARALTNQIARYILLILQRYIGHLTDHEGKARREISPLRVIFHRIP